MFTLLCSATYLYKLWTIVEIYLNDIYVFQKKDTHTQKPPPKYSKNKTKENNKWKTICVRNHPMVNTYFYTCILLNFELFQNTFFGRET